MALQIGEELGRINYGDIKSTLYWIAEKGVTIEVMDLGNDIFLLRGAKHYYISQTFMPDMQTKLEQTGTFSDYLKESWPSFELSVLYINTLSTALAQMDKKNLKEKVEEKKRHLKQFDLQLTSLRHDRDAGLASENDVAAWQKKIDELKKELEKDEEELKTIEQIEKEYKQKGNAASYILKRQTEIYESSASEIPSFANLIVEELMKDRTIVKDQTRKGLNIGIEEMNVPYIAWMAESVGLFDPKYLEPLVMKYPKLAEVKETLQKTFIGKWAKEAVVGSKKFAASSAHAQGIAELLLRAAGTRKEYYLKSPDWKMLQQYDPKRRQSFMGFVVDGNLEVTRFPLYLDYDSPTNYAFLGSARFGKTVAASVFLEGALSQGIPVVVLDPTGSWTGFLEKCDDPHFTDLYPDFDMDMALAQAEKNKNFGYAGKIFTPASDVGLYLSTNLLAPPVISNEEQYKNEMQINATETSEIIAKLCELGDNEKQRLANLLVEAWEEEEFLDYEELLERTDGVLNQRLQKMRGYHFLFEGEPIDDVTVLWNEKEISIISLNHLEKSQRMWAAYFLLRKILEYFDRQPESRETRLIIAIEEVHQFEKEAYRVLDKVVRELPKRGVRAVLVTQKMTDLTSNIRENIAARFYFRQLDENEIQRIADDLGSDFKLVMSKLPQGMAVANLPDQLPFLVQFRPPFHKMTGLSDAEIAKATIMWKEHEIVFEKEEAEKKEGELADDDIFLEAVKKYFNTNKEPPFFNEIKRQLKWGAGKASKAKNSLIRKKLLKEVKEGKFKRLVPLE